MRHRGTKAQRYTGTEAQRRRTTLCLRYFVPLCLRYFVPLCLFNLPVVFSALTMFGGCEQSIRHEASCGGNTEKGVVTGVSGQTKKKAAIRL